MSQVQSYTAVSVSHAHAPSLYPLALHEYEQRRLPPAAHVMSRFTRTSSAPAGKEAYF